MLDLFPTFQLLADELDSRRLRVAMLAPPWIPIPPPGYGGIEAVVAPLCEALAARGHDVTLFAAPGSRSSARVRTLLDAAHPDTIGSALHESDHVAGVFDAIDEAAERGQPFDVLHDHSGFAALAMAARVSAPVGHTLHGTLTGAPARFYARHGHKALLVAISHSQLEHAPPGVRAAAVVPNPIALESWPLQTAKDDYLLWIGRMDPVKRAHRAIDAARRAGRPLVQGRLLPRADRAAHRRPARAATSARSGGVAKQQLFALAARAGGGAADADPRGRAFGMVMLEALACGTPVIAFLEAAATKIVIDGQTACSSHDETEMAQVAGHVGGIDPSRCRGSVRALHPGRGSRGRWHQTAPPAALILVSVGR